MLLINIDLENSVEKHLPAFSSELYSGLKKGKARKKLLIYWAFTDRTFITGSLNPRRWMGSLKKKSETGRRL